VPILQGEAELKKVVNYHEPDDAYLIMLDGTGRIVQQTHGSLIDSNYSPLFAKIQSLLGQK